MASGPKVKDGRTLLVTGARGTVGGYVVTLAESMGFRVVASDLSARGVRVPVRGEVRPADLRDASAMRGLVAGCDAVIHTAAQLDVSKSAADLAAINSEAVAALYEAAASAGAKRFVHLGPASLYDREYRGVLDEDAPLGPDGPYSMSKLGAELYFRGLPSGGSAPDWTVLRAAPIYGRRGRHFASALLAIGPLFRMLSPAVPRPGGGHLGTMAHAEDVARAALFVLSKPETYGRAINVADGDVMPLGERIGCTYDAYGLRSVPVGEPPAELVGRLAELLSRAGVAPGLDVGLLAAWRLVVWRHDLKPALRPRFDPEILASMRRDLVVDASRLRALGWTPRFPEFRAGFAEVLRWYQAERWVPRYG